MRGHKPTIRGFVRHLVELYMPRPEPKKTLSLNQQPSSTKRLLYSRKEATHLLSLSLRKVDELLATGELPRLHVHGRVFITRIALERFASEDHILVATGKEVANA
jgi:hypothetical protein